MGGTTIPGRIMDSLMRARINRVMGYVAEDIERLLHSGRPGIDLHFTANARPAAAHLGTPHRPGPGPRLAPGFFLRSDKERIRMYYTDDMVANYNRIMLDGRYYDYGAVAANIAAVQEARRILELGVGTGLVIDHLLKDQAPLTDHNGGYHCVTGVDVTPKMIAEAREFLGCYPQVRLYEQDVTDLRLPELPYDAAFSYGGPWYFVPSPDGGFDLISHITSDAGTLRGLERTAAHLAPGGRLMLGIQAPHREYSRPLGGAIYRQKLTPLDEGFRGFRKEYLLTDDAAPPGADPRPLQVTDYRVFDYGETLAMLEKCGLTPVPPEALHGPMFLEFVLPA